MNNWLNSAIATCGFEVKRSLTFQRMAVSVVMALFPPLMLALLIMGPRSIDSGAGLPFTEFVIIFLVSLVCVLTLLLWATPNVYSELEGKSWMFVASRPGGRIGIFLGKYMAAVLFSFVVSFVALTLSVGIGTAFSTLEDPVRLWLSMTAIFTLACLTYGAVFSLIGVLTFRRAMVVGVGYIIVSDGILANFPALISRFTARYHLQSLGLEWVGWFLPNDKEAYQAIFGETSVSFNLISLAALTLVALAAGMYFIVNRQYITSDET